MEKKFCQIEDDSQFELDLLRIDLPEDQRYIICQRCLTWQQINGKSVLHFKDIMENDDKKLVMPNWPIFIDESQKKIQDDLKDIFKNSQQKYQNMINKVEKFYQGFQDIVNHEIVSSKKKMIEQVNKYENLENELLKQYNEIQQKQKLQEFQQKLTNGEGKEDFVKFIKEMRDKKVEHTKLIEDEIKKYRNKMSLFDCNQPDKILKEVINLVKKISFFKDTQQEDEPFQDLIAENQEQNRQNIKKVFHLISNKSNFCNQKFLIEFEQFLNKSTQLLTQTVDFSNIHILNYEQPIDFSQVSLIALKEIVESPQINRSNSFLQNIQQSFLANIFIDYKLNIPKNLFQLIENQQSKKYLNISTNGSSIQIERIGQLLNNQHITENFQNTFATAVTTFDIKKEFMHIFRYKYSKKISNCGIYAGLISEQNLNNSLKSDNYFISGLDDNCFKKVIRSYQNQDYKQLFQTTDTLEFRVHIEKNLISVMDYPNYNFIITVDQVMFNQQINYRFGFDFYQPEEKVQLIYFDIIYQL
ncbi:hypothetical protein TTHERM_01307940 (macronuclear) [Tetrahymena thermophila SB210]|uniref:Zinc carboxypeptidase family protein n=1 Tax=Tetrahymena thermophila (strain SB210) TaxID=312017 RepID=Q22A01_TETTS|nr:hypothetical protein TTHERM_01307940 [Tetrahymena thermophila SB210]EAR82110.1 hypothetical protein TTHERM_01307940 [Tetrahymena thermophila SB210]|eukprot:XP_001029773.1 hypothetical protein TTHERM_01307940 [Tetrahymena thermophila SB210]